eukprot:856068_1
MVSRPPPPPPPRRQVRIPPHAVVPRNIRGQRGGLVHTLAGNSKLRVREGSMLSSWMETQMVPWMPAKRGRAGKSMGRSTSINSGYRPLSGPSRTSSNTILSSMSHHNGRQTRMSSSGRYNTQQPMAMATHSQLQSGGGPGAIRIQSHPARSQIIHSQSSHPPAPPYNQPGQTFVRRPQQHSVRARGFSAHAGQMRGQRPRPRPINGAGARGGATSPPPPPPPGGGPPLCRPGG